MNLNYHWYQILFIHFLFPFMGGCLITYLINFSEALLNFFGEILQTHLNSDDILKNYDF